MHLHFGSVSSSIGSMYLHFGSVSSSISSMYLHFGGADYAIGEQPRHIRRRERARISHILHLYGRCGERKDLVGSVCSEALSYKCMRP